MKALAGLLASVFVACLAACSATPGAGTVPSGASTAVSGAASAIASAAGAGGTAAAQGGGPDACSLLSDAEIKAATTFAVVKKTAGQEMGIYANGCRWELDSGTAGLTWTIVLGVKAPGGRSYYDAYLGPYLGAPVSGLGDAAVRGEAGTIAAVKGDTLVALQYIQFPSPKEDMAAKLIGIVFSHV